MGREVDCDLSTDEEELQRERIKENDKFSPKHRETARKEISIKDLRLINY